MVFVEDPGGLVLDVGRGQHGNCILGESVCEFRATMGIFVGSDSWGDCFQGQHSHQLKGPTPASQVNIHTFAGTQQMRVGFMERLSKLQLRRGDRSVGPASRHTP
jgi:hypothetical protein